MKTKQLFLLLFLISNIFFSYADNIDIEVSSKVDKQLEVAQEEKGKSWIVSMDDQVISKTIEKWANQEGYRLIWDASIDFQIQTPGVIYDSLEQAVIKLLKSFDNNEYHLQIKWYKEKSLLVVKQVNIAKNLSNSNIIPKSEVLNLTQLKQVKDKIDINHITELKSKSTIKPVKLLPLKVNNAESAVVKVVESASKSKDAKYTNYAIESKPKSTVKPVKPLPLKVNKTESAVKKVVESASKSKDAKYTNHAIESKPKSTVKPVKPLPLKVNKTESAVKKVVESSSKSKDAKYTNYAIESKPKSTVKPLPLKVNKTESAVKKVIVKSVNKSKDSEDKNYSAEAKIKLLILKPEINMVETLQQFKKTTFVPAIVPQEKPQIWIIDLDDKVISTTLNKWATKEGYTLIWDATTDFQIQTPGIVKGAFKSAVNEVLKSFKDTDNPLRANWYKNKVIKITSVGNISI